MQNQAHTLSARRAAAPLLSLSLSLILAACGGGGGGTSTDSSTPTSSANSSQARSSSSSTNSAIHSSSASSLNSSQNNSASSQGTASSMASQSSQASSACAALTERIRITQPTLPALSAVSDEYAPVVLAPYGSNGSLIAWKEKSATQIRVGTLASDDKQFGALLSTAGDEVHAMVGHASGGALLMVSNDPDIYSSKYCKSDATPGNPACQKMSLLRFNGSGSVLSNTTLTDKTNVDSEGALFIWWYGHTGRLAWDGSRYAAYFRSAGSYARPNVAGEIDIHAGDTLRMLDANGNRLSTGGWQWGCSHSWSVRLAGNSSGWSAFCHGDAYPNGMRLQQLTPTGVKGSTSEWLSNTDATTRALGGVVADANGYWLSYLETTGSLRLHLARFNNSGTMTSDQIISTATGIDASYPYRPYLGKLGNQLLLGWKSSGKLVLQATDANGNLLGTPVTSAAAISNFDEFVTLGNGDLVFAKATSSGAVSVTRVLACGS